MFDHAQLIRKQLFNEYWAMIRRNKTFLRHFNIESHMDKGFTWVHKCYSLSGGRNRIATIKVSFWRGPYNVSDDCKDPYPFSIGPSYCIARMLSDRVNLLNERVRPLNVALDWKEIDRMPNLLIALSNIFKSYETRPVVLDAIRLSSKENPEHCIDASFEGEIGWGKFDSSPTTKHRFNHMIIPLYDIWVYEDINKRFSKKEPTLFEKLFDTLCKEKESKEDQKGAV